MLLAAVADEQVIAATAATISFQGVDQYGDPGDPGNGIRVTVANSSGTTIVDDAATSGSGTDPRTYTLSASNIPNPEQLTATWSTPGAGSAVVGVTTVDVIGAALISKADFITREPLRANVSDDEFRQVRREVDDLFRRVTGRSFVPRLDVERLRVDHYTPNLVLRYPGLARVVWATDEDGVAVPGATAIVPDESGIARLDDRFWPACETITVAYEHGFRRPPDDVRGAAAKLIAARLRDGNSGVPVRASSVTNPLGSTTFTPIAGYGRAVTAIPEVDEVLNRYKWAGMGIA